MNIAELFVNLGVKGSDKTIGALGGMRSGLKENASMALETKAALVGVFYALQRIFSASGAAGTNLTNFNSLLGVSAKTLQQYQYAARQVGVSNQEVEGSFKALQIAMTKTLMGEGAPKGLAQVAKITGDLKPEDIARFAQSPELLIQKLQEYAQKETHTGLRNEVLKSFGINENMISALSRNAFRPEILSKAPTYSDTEVKALDKANIAWSNLGNKIEMAFGRFNAEHGGQLVNDISKITDQVIKLADALVNLAEKTKIFEIIGKAFEGWTQIFGLLSGQIDSINDKGFSKTMEDNAEEGGWILKGLFDMMPSMFKSLMPDIIGDAEEISEPYKEKNQKSRGPSGSKRQTTKKKRDLKESNDQSALTKPRLQLVIPQSPALQNAKSAIAPTMPAALASNSPNTQNIDIKQTLNFQHEGKNAAQISDSLKKSVKDAFRQMPAQSQGA